MKDFLTALKNQKYEGRIPVIPDIKCFSPKEGDLLCGRDPVRIARDLVNAGACALSVVTEEKEFHGSLDLLRAVCAAVDVPVLRKDFLETEEDMQETKEAGASAVLLMYSCLGRERLENMYRCALRIGLVPFVETHTAENLKWAAELGAPLVGINNRDILILEKDDGDISHAESLLKAAPVDAFIVVESGIFCGEEVRRAAKGGADAALVGTAILKAGNTAAAYRSLTRPCGIKICGITDERGIEICLHYHIDMLGFVTEYPVDVPWNLTERQTAVLLNHFHEKTSRMQNGTGCARTCIVTGGNPEKVISLAKRLRPDAVQLHGSETFAKTEDIARALKEEKILTIRSVPTDRALRRRMFGTEDLNKIIGSLEDSFVDSILLDSRDAGNAAGGGGSILDDPGFSRERLMKKALMTGGGITAATIRDAICRFSPDCIDIMTGSETAPGRKSETMISEIVRAVENNI